jgi:TPR repeat protein
MPLLFGNRRWSLGFLVLVSTMVAIFSIIFGVLLMSLDPHLFFSSQDSVSSLGSSYVWMSAPSSEELNQDYQRGLECMRKGEIEQASVFFSKCSLQVCESALLECDLMRHNFDFSIFDDKIARSASAGNPDAQYLYALLLSNRFTNISDYTAESFPKSVLHLYAASTASHHGALMAMGYRHLKGYGVPKRCETAALNYLEVAKPVANIYATSVPRAVELVRLGVEKDKKILSISEISLFTEVASVNPEIALAVGKRFLLGTDGFPQDFISAKNFLEIAAAGQDTKSMAAAQALIGYLHALGLGVPQDMQKAEKFFEISQEDGMGLNGLGFVRFKQERFAEAFSLFNQSAAANSPDGMFNLASFFLTGTGTNQNFQKAFMFYTEALKRGHTPAGYALAVMHLNGIGTVRDCTVAVSLLKEVAERSEYVSSLLRSAYALLDKGEPERAALQFLKLAEAGHQVSQENLAHLIDSGRTTKLLAIEGDRAKIFSQRFFEMAVDQGSIKSALKLGDLAFYGGGIKADLVEQPDGDVAILHSQQTEPDFESAVRWYSKARDQGNKISALVGVTWIEQLLATAEFNLGYMHQFGLGVRKNLYDAAKHYKRSIPESSHGKKIFEFLVDTFVHSPETVLDEQLEPEPQAESLSTTLLRDYRFLLLFLLSWGLAVLIYLRLLIR